jgi:hypothetical protein
MDAGTVTAIISGSVVTVVGVVYTLIRLLRPAVPTNGNGQASISKAIDLLSEAIKEQTCIMRGIHEKLIGMGYEQCKIADATSRVEQSQIALHRRFDAVTGPRE